MWGSPQDGKETTCPWKGGAGAAMGGDGCGEDPGSATGEGYGEGGGAKTLLPQGSLPLYPSHSHLGLQVTQPDSWEGWRRAPRRWEELWGYIFQQSSHEQPSPRGGGILENWGRGEKPSTSLPVEVQGNVRTRRGSCRDWFTARARKVGASSTGQHQAARPGNPPSRRGSGLHKRNWLLSGSCALRERLRRTEPTVPAPQIGSSLG